MLRRVRAAIAIAALALTIAGPACAAQAQASARTEAPPEAVRVAYVAGMEGRKADALAAVQELAASPVDRLLAAGGSGWELTPRYAALVRFGLWDELIAQGPPDPRAPGLTAGYIYGRGVALAARGRLPEARAALAGLTRLEGGAAAEAGAAGGGLRALIDVAVPVVAARIAATELRNADAISELERAAAAEDRLPADGGAGWFFPVRHLLGAQLLIAGRAAEAEHVYREDLQRHPGNGWALYGLTAALRAQGRKAAADASAREYSRAWKHADVRLLSSAFWFAGPDTTSCECERPAAD